MVAQEGVGVIVSLVHILYNRKELLKKNKTVILASSFDLSEILTIKENEFPNTALYTFENKGITVYKRIGRIKCHRCQKDVLVVDVILPPAFPFCGKRCQLLNLVSMLDAGKEEKKDATDYSNIE